MKNQTLCAITVVIISACLVGWIDIPNTIRAHRAGASACKSLVALGHRAESDIMAMNVCEDVWSVATSESGMNPYLAVSVSRVESHYNPAAISRAGAVGPMQVMPHYHCPTFFGLRICSYNGSIRSGVSYLNYLVTRNGINTGLSMYNCGPSGYRSMTDTERESCHTYRDNVLRIFNRIQ